MRIVGGEYSSRRIETRKGNETRPTLDKVREAVFSSLGGRFEGGTFLDLYAGSGANGLEALSRGMDEAVFVDNAHEAVSVIRKNIASLDCAERTRVLHMKDVRALQLLKEEGKKFSAVYLDPPYARQHNDQILKLLDEYDLLEDNAAVIIESAKQDTFDRSYGNLQPVREREYGMTKITYYRKNEENKKMKACYPGTFDPITKGHLDIIQRAASKFDEVEVLIMANVRKKCLFSEEERKQMIEDSLKEIGSPANVSVCIGHGLTVRFAREIGANAIIRGIRAVSDYEYELQQATANMILDEDLETIFLIAKPEFSFLSSSVVKEIALNKGDISEFVPAAIIDRVLEKYAD